MSEIQPWPQLLSVWSEWFPKTVIKSIERFTTDAGVVTQIMYDSDKGESYVVRVMGYYVMAGHVIGDHLEPHYVSVGSINALCETV